MSNGIFISDILKREKPLLIITKDSELSFWEYQFRLPFNLGHIKKDCFIITDTRITYIVRDKIITNEKYLNLSSVTFNSSSDSITYTNEKNMFQTYSLKHLRLSFEEIQEIKKTLNNND